MDLDDIRPVLAEIQDNPVVTDLRSHTYLSTYPGIIQFAQQINPDSDQQFRQLALMVYGWMPRVLRIDPAHVQQAVVAMEAARNATIGNYKVINISHIKNCLHSLVGASKLLHFLNPEVFPIWDKRIQSFCRRPNSNYSMRKVDNYYQYADEVHAITCGPDFPEFFNQYCAANANRLASSNIENYQVSQIRAVEASAFELAP